MKKNLPIVILVAITFLVFYLFFDFTGIHLPVEKKFYDLKQNINMDREFKPGNILIVDVDDKTLNELGRFQNWPRYNFANVIEKISLQNPLVIGVDFIFSEPDTLNNITKNIYRELLTGKVKQDMIDSILNIFSFDQYLSSSINMTGKVVLAGILNYEKTEKEIKLERQRIEEKIEVEPVYSGIILPIEEFLRNSRIGIINVNPDFDGVIRNVQLVTNYNNNLLPAFSLSVVNTINKNLSLCNGKIGIGDKVIKTDRFFNVNINYLCNFESFNLISFSDVFYERIPMNIFKDKIVLLGSSSSGLADLKNTPVGIMPGIEIHANIILNILNNCFVNFAPFWLEYITGFILILFVFFVAIKIKPLISIIIFILSLLFFVFINIFIYILFLYSIEFARPIITMIISYLIGLGFRLTIVEAEKRKLRQSFSKYVPPDVVEKILSSKDLYIKGERKEVTVLFCDIRDYTGYSEKEPPEKVVSTLNEYFEEMSNIIFAYNGMIDKFLGDGIMAVFGAPIHFPGHADKAVTAAIEMVKKARDLNRRWQKDRGRNFEIGIGINTGVAIVGNVGSMKRIEYTAIGDVVNTAARLEPLNKEFLTNILISETTFNRLQNDYNVRNLGKVKIRGKTEEITIYEIVPF